MSNWVDIPAPPVLPARPGSGTGFEALRWVKANCPTYITNDAVQKNAVLLIQKGGQYYYRFYFRSTPEGDRDRTMFALRWS